MRQTALRAEDKRTWTMQSQVVSRRQRTGNRVAAKWDRTRNGEARTMSRRKSKDQARDRCQLLQCGHDDGTGGIKQKIAKLTKQILGLNEAAMNSHIQQKSLDKLHHLHD